MRTFYLIYILLFSIVNAQEIKFISKTTNKPLANVLVFDKNGNVLTKNLIGKIASSLTQLVYSLRFLKMILRNKRMPENRF